MKRSNLYLWLSNGTSRGDKKVSDLFLSVVDETNSNTTNLILQNKQKKYYKFDKFVMLWFLDLYDECV